MSFTLHIPIWLIQFIIIPITIMGISGVIVYYVSMAMGQMNDGED